MADLPPNSNDNGNDGNDEQQHNAKRKGKERADPALTDSEDEHEAKRPRVASGSPIGALVALVQEQVAGASRSNPTPLIVPPNPTRYTLPQPVVLGAGSDDDYFNAIVMVLEGHPRTGARFPLNAFGSSGSIPTIEFNDLATDPEFPVSAIVQREIRELAVSTAVGIVNTRLAVDDRGLWMIPPIHYHDLAFTAPFVAAFVNWAIGGQLGLRDSLVLEHSAYLASSRDAAGPSFQVPLISDDDAAVYLNANLEQLLPDPLNHASLEWGWTFVSRLPFRAVNRYLTLRGHRLHGGRPLWASLPLITDGSAAIFTILLLRGNTMQDLERLRAAMPGLSVDDYVDSFIDLLGQFHRILTTGSMQNNQILADYIAAASYVIQDQISIAITQKMQRYTLTNVVMHPYLRRNFASGLFFEHLMSSFHPLASQLFAAFVGDEEGQHMETLTILEYYWLFEWPAPSGIDPFLLPAPPPPPPPQPQPGPSTQAVATVTSTQAVSTVTSTHVGATITSGHSGAGPSLLFSQDSSNSPSTSTSQGIFLELPHFFGLELDLEHIQVPPTSMEGVEETQSPSPVIASSTSQAHITTTEGGEDKDDDDSAEKAKDAEDAEDGDDNRGGGGGNNGKKDDDDDVSPGSHNTGTGSAAPGNDNHNAEPQEPSSADGRHNGGQQPGGRSASDSVEDCSQVFTLGIIGAVHTDDARLLSTSLRPQPRHRRTSRAVGRNLSTSISKSEGSPAHHGNTEVPSWRVSPFNGWMADMGPPCLASVDEPLGTVIDSRIGNSGPRLGRPAVTPTKLTLATSSNVTLAHGSAPTT